MKFLNSNHKTLSLFITAGYPTIETTVPLAVAMAEAGADLIELGIPFSDPMADGPTIQHSSELALRNGVTLRKTLDLAREIRKRSSIPLVLMGYANPIYAYGLEQLLGEAHDSGVQGMIIPDLSLEESSEYRSIAQRKEMATIFLAAPTTPPDRLARLDEASTGFLYCVSITGVTGERQKISNQTGDFLRMARTKVKNNPLLVGFGISTPEDAREVASMSDGVIIGSALIKTIQSTSSSNILEQVSKFVGSMRNALDAR
ncbi:MAG TPA: tryptophan synthase subunit alpha [Bacteroidota bacterium]|nr:tryptophan synthase subunit alpha [Bacteroidota bacterium]